MNNQTKHINKLVTSAVFLALALVLPFLTGQIRTIGNMLCPMHFPIIICAYVCGWEYAAAIGFIAPLLRFALFGMPPIIPGGISMAFELATYGLVCGLLYTKLPKKKSSIYISLIAAMISGRIIWGLCRLIIAGISKNSFVWATFIAGGITNAIPGIILQIILIPIIVMALEKWSKA